MFRNSHLNVIVLGTRWVLGKDSDIIIAVPRNPRQLGEVALLFLGISCHNESLKNQFFALFFRTSWDVWEPDLNYIL